MDQEQSKETALREREKRQLRRLEVFVDVVFAVVLWRFFTFLPKPNEGNLDWGTIGAFLSANLDRLVIVFLGVVIVIVYWIQNNALFGNLQRTDAKHTALAILQVFFLLFFLYIIRIGVSFEGTIGARFMESVAAALVGFTAVFSWMYAKQDHRLLSPALSQQDADDFQIRILAEPLTALITMPFAFIGPVAWELAWLVYPLCVKVLRRQSNNPQNKNSQ